MLLQYTDLHINLLIHDKSVKLAFKNINSNLCFIRYEALVDTVAKKYKKNQKKRKQHPTTSESSDSDEDSLKKRAKRGFIKPREEEFEF